MVPVMTVRMLLKSWAMPPVSWPTASIFCACRSCSSAAIFSVRSRMKPLNTMPSRRRSAVMLSSTLISLAVAPQRLDFEALPEDRALAGAQEALDARSVRVAMGFRDDQIAEVSGRSPRSRGQPNIASACEFQSVTSPGLVHLHEGVERGIDDAARQLLAFAQRLLRKPALGHVAADEEVAA